MARNKIVSLEAQHVEKRIVGFDDATFEVPDDDPDDIGVDEAPNLRLLLLKIAIQSGIIEGDCRLRCQQFQYRHAARCKGAGSQVVLEVKRTDEFAPVYQGQAEN